MASAQGVVFPSGGQIPEFKDVSEGVWRYFRKDEEFQADDLLTDQTVAPLLKQLQQQWLPPADAAKILERVPTDDEFLSVQLSTEKGKKFMRQIAKYQNGYDRLERLAQLPHGKRTIIDLIRGPDGYKMIEYMTTTKGGKAIGEQLSNAPDGENFNEPTGRIYTVALLLESLQQSREALVKASEKGKKKR